MKKGKRDEKPDRFVRLLNDEIDSAAFKTLSADAVWLLIQIKRTWHTKDGWICYSLPRGHVRFRLSDRAYSKAIKELLAAGFLDVGSVEGGIMRTAKRYRPSERWRKVSEGLLKDPKAGQVVRRWHLADSRKDEYRISEVWIPKSTRSLGRGLAEYMERQKSQKALLKLRERRSRNQDQKNSKKKKTKP